MRRSKQTLNKIHKVPKRKLSRGELYMRAWIKNHPQGRNGFKIVPKEQRSTYYGNSQT